MDKNLEAVWRLRAERTAEALRRNRMEAFCVPDRAAARGKVLALLPPGGTVTHGGSMTLQECGIPEALRAGGYRYLDREAPGLSDEGKQAVYRGAFSADCYLGSANAVTEAGELFNVDGNGNRVAAYLYGPKSVVIVAGVNKIVPDVAAALARLRAVAAPANAVRLGCQTPCAAAGRCMDCRTPARICCDYVVQGYQRIENRIKVVLVCEALGY